MSTKLEGMTANLATADSFTGKKVLDREGIQYGKVKHIHIIIVVLFPAPFGPRNPKISPSSTLNEMSSTAFTLPKFLVSDSISMVFNSKRPFRNYKLLTLCDDQIQRVKNEIKV